MKLEDLSVGAVIMSADRKDNLAHTGEIWLVTRFINVKAKFEAVCLHSLDFHRIGETRIILFDELPDYELITALCVQPTSDNLFFRNKPATPKKDLYLRWSFGIKTSLGKIGDKTPYKLENGRNLVVGDIVKISRDGEEHSGCVVAHDGTDGYFIMGIALECNDRKGEISGWNVTLESDFHNRLKGDTLNAGDSIADIEVVDFNPEEK